MVRNYIPSYYRPTGRPIVNVTLVHSPSVWTFEAFSAPPADNASRRHPIGWPGSFDHGGTLCPSSVSRSDAIALAFRRFGCHPFVLPAHP